MWPLQHESELPSATQSEDLLLWLNFHPTAISVDSNYTVFVKSDGAIMG